MKKILWEVYTALRRFQIFVIDSKIHQTLHFYLKSTKTNRPAKVTRVLSGKFIESSTTLLNRARRHKCSSKYAQQTCFNESKLWKQICIKLTSILFEEVPKSTELLNYFSEVAVNHSISNCKLAVQQFSLSHYHKQSLLFASQLVSGKLSQLKVKIYRLRIVSSTNISTISVVLILHKTSSSVMSWH